MTRMVICILVLALAGACAKEEELATAPTTSDFEKQRAELAARVKGKDRGQTRARPNAAPGTPDGTEFGLVDNEYVYDPTGKRDPFRSFILTAEDDREDSRGPLEQFDLAQLSVIAVVWGIEKPRAVVADPSGRGYIVREGTYMGKNEGRITAIADNALTVKETYVDYFGETTSKDVTMRVRVEKEGNKR